MILLDLLKTPDDFDGRPWGYAQNQIGHMAVGAGLVWLLGLLMMPIWVALALYAVWEVTQVVLYGAKESDGLEDFAFVAAGASLSLLAVSLGAVFLASGFVRRMEDQHN